MTPMDAVGVCYAIEAGPPLDRDCPSGFGCGSYMTMEPKRMRFEYPDGKHGMTDGYVCSRCGVACLSIPKESKRYWDTAQAQEPQP